MSNKEEKVESSTQTKFIYWFSNIIVWSPSDSAAPQGFRLYEKRESQHQQLKVLYFIKYNLHKTYIYM